ncbi:DUF3952 domain-containing protein [Bacillus manliponensis]|uniref:DUF3952 domain-containing protein n=1 Tax=Bacillus manliponensis TaxID=574376 RepID=UPI003510F743
MKQKLMIKLTAVVTTVATLLGGCGIVGETKIEYERLVKALDEGDMATVMSAGEDGYAYVEEQVIFSTREDKEDGVHKKVVYQTTEGIYNAKEKNLYGSTAQSIVTDIEKEEDPTSRENYNEEDIYETDIVYKGGTVNSSNPNVDTSYVPFLLDRLQGIGKLTPNEDTKKGSEPNSVGYSLTEEQFQKLFNGTWNIKYDEFKSANIVLVFDSAKDHGESSMNFAEIRLVLRFKRMDEEGQNTRNSYQISYSFDSKEGNEENNSKEVYMNNKKIYENE